MRRLSEESIQTCILCSICTSMTPKQMLPFLFSTAKGELPGTFVLRHPLIDPKQKACVCGNCFKIANYETKRHFLWTCVDPPKNRKYMDQSLQAKPPTRNRPTELRVHKFAHAHLPTSNSLPTLIEQRQKKTIAQAWAQPNHGTAST